MSDEIIREDEEMDDGIITLTDDEGNDVDFEEIAGIEIDDRFYLILVPVELPEGMGEDEALVFEVSGEEGDESFEMVVDDAILDAVFAEYERLISEEAEEEE